MKQLLNYIGKNRILILLIIITLICCVLTIHRTGTYVESCNDYWQDQIEKMNCLQLSGMNAAPFELKFNDEDLSK